MYAEFVTKVEKRFLHTLDLDTEVISSSSGDNIFSSPFVKRIMSREKKGALTPVSGFKDPDIEKAVTALYSTMHDVDSLGIADR